MPPGGCGGVCGGGVTPTKKSKKGGSNSRGGGPDMQELQNFLKMKDFFAENCFAKDFGNFCFRKNNVEIFVVYNVEIFWCIPNFGIHPPNRKPVGTALKFSKESFRTVLFCVFSFSAFV